MKTELQLGNYSYIQHMQILALLEQIYNKFPNSCQHLRCFLSVVTIEEPYLISDVDKGSRSNSSNIAYISKAN